MKIPAERLRHHPDVVVPNNQCTHYRSCCQGCGERFLDKDPANPDVNCRICGEERTRCPRSREEGTREESCWAHNHKRAWNIYSVISGRMGDIVFEDVLARDDRSVAQEMALARTALMALGALDRDQKPGAFETLEAVKMFMEIAALRKKVEDGDTLNIRVTDEVAGEIRRNVERFILAFARALDEVVTDEELRLRVLARARELAAAAEHSPLRSADAPQDEAGQIVRLHS